MTFPMCPIVTEIIQKEQDKESPNVIGDLEKSEFFKEKSINPYGENFKKYSCYLRNYPTIDIGNRIIQSVTRVFLESQNKQFYPHQDKIHRNGNDDRTQIHLTIS